MPVDCRLFWIIGAFSLFAAALGIVDYTSRLAADVIKTSYARNANESKVYAVLVWGLVLIGIVVLLAGFSQPIVLLVISAVDPARADPHPRRPPRRADLVLRAVRRAVGAHLPGPDQRPLRLTAPTGRPAR